MQTKLVILVVVTIVVTTLPYIKFKIHEFKKDLGELWRRRIEPEAYKEYKFVRFYKIHNETYLVMKEKIGMFWGREREFLRSYEHKNFPFEEGKIYSTYDVGGIGLKKRIRFESGLMKCLQKGCTITTKFI